MSSAAEARFRVQAPNSIPRAIKVIALDAAGEAVVRRLAEAVWNHATFFTAASRVEPGGGNLPTSPAAAGASPTRSTPRISSSSSPGPAGMRRPRRSSAGRAACGA